MNSDTKSMESTQHLLTIPPESEYTLMGIDFDPSGYGRKVELLNKGSGINSHTPCKNSGIEVRRTVVD